MNTLSYEARIERLNTFITEGRVLRGKWRTTEADGRELACLLAALPPVLGPGYTYTVKYLRATTIRDRFFTVCRLVAGLDSAGRQDEIPETSLWSRP